MKIFKKEGIKTTISPNKKTVDFLNLHINLETAMYQLYSKPMYAQKIKPPSKYYTKYARIHQPMTNDNFI